MATGINVGKANLYAVLAPPQGIVVAKAVLYAVLAPPNASPPAWGSWSFGSGVVGVAYDQGFDMPGAASPTTYTLISGALPDGLELHDISGNAGHIHGTPTTAGTFTFTLRATNSAGSADKEFSITIAAATSGGAYCFAWIG